MGSLKLFIKAVRKAKTIADERTVVRKESASIRTSFRDPNLDQTTRRINISKLLYLYILGEKTHFGQVECLKLLASPRFADKRLGYLAVMLLLDENQEVLTLLTNSLDNDMQHPNMFIVGLALTCFGNVASPELARDLHANVDKILKSTSSTYLRKKSCLVAAKLVAKEPDLFEVFLPHASNLLNEKQPAVLLGLCRLIQEIYIHCPDNRDSVIKFIPKLISHLKRISTSGYLPDYDVMGVSDPFLQVTLLETLRLLATSDSCPGEYLEQLNDILTHVASNLESGKNAAHAILYECIRTIFAIKSDQSLRVLGVNLLGKFLLTKDNNIRYVALEMLLVVIDFEPLAVQRHRSTIVTCLSDGDVSIRRRALELGFAILNEQNIRVMMKEILTFLEKCPEDDLKSYITSQITIASAKYAPNEKLHFDTLIRMLKVSGNYITPDINSGILALIMKCSSTELKKHVVSRLFASSIEDKSQYSLGLITTWCIGEYADLVLGSDVECHGKKVTISETAILDLLDAYINNSEFSEAETVQLVSYILTAVIKLSVKFRQLSNIEKLRLILNSRQYDNNLELQTRAIEFQQIFGQDAKLKQGLLAHMPAPPVKHREKLSLYAGDSDKPILTTTTKTANAGNGGQEGDLLDLIDDATDPKGTSNDLLLDIFGGGTGQNGKSLPNPEDTRTPGDEEGFNDGHLRIGFGNISGGNGQVSVEATITSVSPSQIDKVQVLFAVPKAQKLTISNLAGTDSLVSALVIKQGLKITGKSGSRVKLRVKVKYNLDGVNREDQFDFGGIQQTL